MLIPAIGFAPKVQYFTDFRCKSDFKCKAGGTVKFSSEIAKSLNFTAERTENAKAPEKLAND